MDVNWFCILMRLDTLVLCCFRFSKMSANDFSISYVAVPMLYGTRKWWLRVTSWTKVCSVPPFLSVLRQLPLAGFSYPSLLSHPLGTKCSEWFDFYDIFFIFFPFMAMTLWNIIFFSSWTAGLYNWWPLWAAAVVHLNHDRLGSDASEFITFWKASCLFVFRLLLLWRGRLLSGRKRSMEQNSQ